MFSVYVRGGDFQSIGTAKKAFTKYRNTLEKDTGLSLRRPDASF